MDHTPIAIGVLGPLEITCSGRTVPVPGRHARAVLAALVVTVGHAVAPDHLQFLVWGDDPPSSGLATLHSHISRLRRLLGPDSIITSGAGYTLAIDPGAIDAVRFERLALAAGDLVAIDPAQARERCREALALWRGAAFGDLADHEFAHLECLRLDDLRMTTMEVYLEAELALGRARWVTAALEAAVEEDAYREHLWALLIRALTETGRRREAAQACDRVRHLLGQVGLDPGDEIRRLEGALFPPS